MLEAEQRGRQEGLETGIKNLIISYKEDDFPKEKIIEKLQKRFELTKEQAEQYFNQVK